MMTVSEFIQKLKVEFPSTAFYNGSIDRKNKQCVGVYARGRGVANKALGGAEQTSYSTLPVSILIHWTENSDLCETTANEIYEKLFNAEGWYVGGKRVVVLNMLDPGPIDLSRDEQNVCEMVIRLNIIYEREG